MAPGTPGSMTLPAILAAHAKSRDANLGADVSNMRTESNMLSIAHRDRDPCEFLDSTYSYDHGEFTKDKLCQDCSKVDFTQLTTREIERQDIGMVATVWRNIWCPFCRIVKAAFREHVDGSATWYKILCQNNLSLRFFVGSVMTRGKGDAKEDQYAHQIEISCVTKEGDTDIVNHISYLDIVSDQDNKHQAPRYSRRSIGTCCNMDLLRSWQENCLRDHDHSEQFTPLPERLLVEGRVRGLDVNSLRLTAMGPEDVYCSLSYVCGDITQTALAARYWKGGDTYVNFDALPQVLKDALWLTRQFGYQFLWVDCLSIKQDDVEDKGILISNMNVIYQRSVLTIISAAGVGLDASLPGITPRSASHVLPEAIETITTKDGSINLALVAYGAHSLLEQSIWSTRGWCYQEHALSPRCLVFTPFECFFTCADGVWREGYHTDGEVRTKGNVRGLNRRYRRDRRKPTTSAAVSIWAEKRVIYSLSHSNESQSFPQYQEAVHDYTGRQLTYKTDIIAAFAGMLRTFCQTEVPYHGIPLSIFEHALCWSESEDAERLNPGSRGYPRTLAVSRKPASKTESSIAIEQAFPTWSWAYWSAPVTYEDSICSGFLGLFDFEQRTADLIVATPRETPKFFKRRGHGDRGHGTMCGQPVEEQPVPKDWKWFPGRSAPQPGAMPSCPLGKPSTLFMWTQCYPYGRAGHSNGDGQRYEILISAWKEMHRPRKVIMQVVKHGDHYTRVGLEHRMYTSYRALEDESNRQNWQWVAIR